MQTVRWGVLGTGDIARIFARDLAYIDEGEIVAIGSRSRESADAYGEAFGVARRYERYEDLVGDDQVDAVYVATPHPFHHANARLALEHDKPVLVEKAFTMNEAEARDLVTLARARGLFLMEAMWTRFLPHVVALRELVGEGRLGELVQVEADHGQYFPLDPDFRLFAPGLGGGALLDLGVYPVSFASMLLGTPSDVRAIVRPAFTGVDGSVAMAFAYDGGAQAVLSCTSLARTATRACVTGTLARVEIDGDFYAPSGFTLVTRDNRRERFEFATRGRGLHYQARAVAGYLEEGRLESEVMPLEESVAIMATMERVLALAADAPRSTGD